MKRVIGVLFMLIISGIFVSAELHNASEFYINVDGDDMNLQDAINYNGLNRDAAYLDTSVFPYHSVNDIWIETGAGYKTLLEALQSKDFDIPTATTLSDKSFYHKASTVTVLMGTQETTIEDAIETEAIACAVNIGSVCDIGDCTNALVDCEGDCIMESYKLTTETCGVEGKCDGVGTCDEVVLHNNIACYSNDRYWYDSWGRVNDKVEECGRDTCEPWECSIGDDWQQKCVDRGCSDGTCYATPYTNTDLASLACTAVAIIDVIDFVFTPIVAAAKWVADPSVVCTELYNTGLMSEEIFARDVEYSKEYFTEDALEGYRSWGIPVVRLMRKDQKVKDITVLIVDSFLEESRYRFGEAEVGNEMGDYYLDNAVPLFERIGVLINDPELDGLFNEDSWISREIELIKEVFYGTNPNDLIVKNYFTEDKVGEMFYDALGDKTKPDMEFTIAFVEELEDAVEDIERSINN